MADREGFEPSEVSLEGSEGQSSGEGAGGESSLISSLKAGNDGPELAEIVAAWPSLSPEIKVAIAAIVRSTGKEVVP